MNNSNPCEGCVCMPICRLKQYSRLVTDCILISNYLLKCPISFSHIRRHNIMSVLDPTTWETGENNILKYLTHD